MPKPGTELTVPAAGTGEVAIVHPDTGKTLILAEATEAQLADWKKAIAEWHRMAKTAEAHVDAELIRRMDARASWTIRGDGFKLTGSSPKPSVSYKDPVKLRKRLLKLAEEGLLERAAVDAALPVVPEQVEVRVGPLAQLEKLGGRVARAVRDYRQVRPKHHRGVRVS
jgi:hypothetical protein